MPRLPQPGGDAGNWGTILNDYLAQTHNTDGTLKDDSVSTSTLQDASVTTPKLGAGAVDTTVLADDSVTTDKIVDGTILETDLATSVQTKLNAVVADSTITPAKLDSDTPADGELLSYNSGNFEWITAPAAGGGGEANTASNIGVSGIGVYKQKTGVNLELKKINPGSAKVSVTDNTTNNTVDLDVSEANLDLANMGGSLPQASVSGLATSLSGKVNTSDVGQINGVASLDGTGKVPVAQLPTASTPADATTSTKGIVQLAGDLGGTAASPTVPGLAGKANTSHSHAIADVTNLQTTLDLKTDETRTITGANSITGGGDLSANRTLALVNDSATPGNSRYYGTNASGTKGWYALSGGGASVGYEHIFLDDMAGATDDDKLTAAIALQQSTAGMPPIVLAARNHTFNQTRNLYSGLKLIGQSTGPKNLEQDPDFVTSRITLGGSVSSGTSSWWVTPGGNLFDIYMADFAVQGNSGSSVHQFIDVTTGSLYACEFHSLAFNFMRSVFGRKDRKCLCTQVLFTGHWTANNLWDTQFFIGGSDNQFWMGGMINIGPSASPLQTGTYADNDYEIIFDTLSKTDIGYIYMSALNGWRGIKVTGTSMGNINFFGGTYEGYNGSTSRAPGTVIRLEGGSGAFYGPHVGQAMMSPDAAEGGYIHMTGGEWSFYAPQFFRGSTADTVPAIYQTGGRLYVTGATRGNQSETWSPRPILETGAAGGNVADTGSYTTYCPDLSMSVT